MKKSILFAMFLLAAIGVAAAEKELQIREISCSGFADGVPVKIEAELLRTYRGFGMLKIEIGDRKFVMPPEALAILNGCDIASMKAGFEDVDKSTFVTVRFFSENECAAVKVDNVTGNVVVTVTGKNSPDKVKELLKTTVTIQEKD